MAAQGLAFEQRFADRHEERSGNTLPRNIANEQAQFVFVREEKVIEIAPDFFCGIHRRKDFEFLPVRKWREGARQHAGLNLSRDAQLAFYSRRGLSLSFEILNEAFVA